MLKQEVLNDVEVTFFFRHSFQGTYSIESIFETIATRVPGAKCVYVPHLGNRLGKIVKNIIFARAHQSPINHVTGDIHYIILGLGFKKINILTIHDCGILLDTSKPKWKRLILKYLWYKWPIQLADKVTTVSDHSRNEILELTNCSPSKVVVVPNYVNSRYVYQEKQFNSSLPRILHIGSTKNKNLSGVIEAIKGLHCELRIIGLISDIDLKALETNGIQYTHRQCVTFESVRQEYCDTDIVVFVSTYEGFGLPILEAQATGRVLITSNISPCREVAGEGAICVNPYKVSEIRDAVQKVIEDEDLRSKVIVAGRQNVMKYALESVVDAYMHIYQSCKV